MAWFRRARRRPNDTAEIDSMVVKTSNRRSQFEEEFTKWVAEMEEQVESTRRSEQLTQEDLAIRINAQKD